MATADQAAAHIFINRRRFHELVARAVLPFRGPEGWNLDEVRERYIKNIQTVAAGREPDDDDGTLNGEYENARVKKETADKLAMENAARRGETITRVDFVRSMQGVIVHVRAKMLSIPSKLAAILAAIDAPRAVQDRLTTAIHEALTELAGTRGVPTPPGEPGSGGGDNGVDEGVRPAAPPDGKRVGRPKPKAKPRGKRRDGKLGHQPG